MIIRNIVDSLRTRNLGTLTMELFIVVLGVFIGIQVSNWNDDRKDRLRGLAYLERISADLEADIESYQGRIVFWNQVRHYGDVALTYAATQDKGEYSDWELILAYFQASQLAEFYTSDTTYQELKSEGALGLIANHDLRSMLAEYYTFADNPAVRERPIYRENVRGIIPLALQSYVWSDCYDSKDGIHQELLDCPPPEDLADYVQVLDSLGRDAALTGQLRYWMSSMQVATLIGEGRTDLANKIRAFIASEIAR